MMKRAAEDDGGPPAKQAAGGKSNTGGNRADEVTNPIPRLFRQNTITFHVTQRTFEEIGPGELKWVPTCQYWAAMFDKFHMNMFRQYFDRCSTFEITDPKVRISNILMLQDNIQVAAGTPQEISVYTQACYLMHYQPRGINNWFKLGVTSDCLTDQTILKYKPLAKSDCNLISQLVKLDNYTDFEKLVINPSKSDAYGGWHSGEVMATRNETTGLKTCKDLVEINADEEALTKNVDYNISEVYISPRSRYFNDFSCSVKGCDDMIQLGKHTSYTRNLDKINLHKYGDSFGFHINTNLDGIEMLNHAANAPFGNVFEKPTKNSTKTDIYSVFCYPSNNRPFYCRRNNLDMIGPVEGNKDFGNLTHHFFTMPPIKKSDGSLLKQRCSFIMEQTTSVTFHFPETVTEDMADNMLEQKKAVIIRPAIVKVRSKDAESTPEVPLYVDWVRDRLRQLIRDRLHIDYPFSPDDINWIRNNPIGDRIPEIFGERWRQIMRLAQICGEWDPQDCPNIDVLLNEVVRGAPTQIDWGGLPIGAPPLESEPVTKAEYIVDKWMPLYENKYPIKIKPVDNKEYSNMITYEIGNRPHAFWGFLFKEFARWLVDTRQHEIPYDRIDWEMPVAFYNYNSLRFNAETSKKFREAGEPLLRGIYQRQCPEYIIRVYPERINNIFGWLGREIPNYDDFGDLTLQRLLPVPTAPLDFNLGAWYQFLYLMHVPVMPEYLFIKDVTKMYNDCIKSRTDEKYPVLPLTDEQIKEAQDKGLLPKQEFRVEPFPENEPAWMNYETDLFFV
uniref:Nonstructural protein n=1 Tax=Motacilla densovirus TaxID=2794502 RepID=A0A8A4XCM6_9VIRU|nr:MAG: nonstructural protein [Motacilla densovirus]